MTIYGMCDSNDRLPPGEYYIGDPCYVILDEDWMDCLESTRYFNLFESDEEKKYRPNHLQFGVFSAAGTLDDKVYRFCGSTTKYGDGMYPCYERGVEIGQCGVDAGLIGAIPVEFIKSFGEESGLELGVIVKFDSEFGIRYDDGIIRFGDDVYVITKDEDEDDYLWVA